MEAAQGALEAGGESVGLAISPELKPNPTDAALSFRYFFVARSCS